MQPAAVHGKNLHNLAAQLAAKKLIIIYDNKNLLLRRNPAHNRRRVSQILARRQDERRERSRRLRRELGKHAADRPPAPRGRLAETRMPQRARAARPQILAHSRSLSETGWSLDESRCT